MKLRLTSFTILSMLLALFSCSTDDVSGPAPYNGPDVVLTTDSPGIIEASGEATITATLAATRSVTTEVELAFAGDATGNGIDYQVSDPVITIAAGDLSGDITIMAIQDTLEEGNESVDISVPTISGGATTNPITLSLIIEDDDVATQAQIIVNEILYDPWNDGLNGDANGDGQYAQNEDEFIEFLNLSSQDADLSGFQIFDTEAMQAGSPKHIFPPNTIVPSGAAIVVFGGGTPTGNFGGSIVQTSTSGDMNLNNAGDVMTLTDANGQEIVRFDIEPLSNNPNESYTRNPDITGDFEQHGDNTPILFSPGTKIDGSPF